MTKITDAPDLAQLDIPMDRWTQGFWDAAAHRELAVPRCGSCHAWRWPPGPFCPECRSQEVAWEPPGPARLFTYTVLCRPGPSPDDPPTIIAPGLVEFPQAGGMRFMAAIVDSPVESLVIGAPLVLGWRQKGETNVPVFSTC